MPGFVFPCGVAPGFNSAHPAAQNATLAAVAQNGNFIDLLSGLRGTITGAPVANIQGVIGPNVKFGGGTDNIAFSGKRSYGVNAAPLADTMAVIMMVNSSAAQQAFLSLGTSGVDSSYSFLATATSNTVFSVGHQGLALASSTWAGALSVPLFIAASQSLTSATGATQTANIVAVRLDTGQIFANSTTNAAYTAGSRNGTFNIGSRGASSQPSTANIAAVIASDQFMSLPALVQWAADPWLLWYPVR